MSLLCHFLKNVNSLVTVFKAVRVPRMQTIKKFLFTEDSHDMTLRREGEVKVMKPFSDCLVKKNSIIT